MTAVKRPLVGVTMGDPGGIGSEIIVEAAPEVTEDASLVVIGDADVIRHAVDQCDSDLSVEAVESVADVRSDPSTLFVLDLDNVASLTYGEIDEAYGRASLEYIERAIELAIVGDIDAIATAPIHKQATAQAGSEFAGHTGMLAAYTETDNYSMMLIEGGLRVTHVSTHVPLREACDLVTTENVLDTITVTNQGLHDLGIDDPTIAVAGLNPHAGEGGLLGTEDDDAIEPAVEQAREAGIDAEGPIPPDTVYVKAAAGAYDCVVSMYHDQGHIPIKMLGFDSTDTVSGVNMTVGLPIIRTSVDHGTAFDIAGQGIASESSMVDAIRTAARVAIERA
ncbi:4-hydroxythreonine-4-phosphate dehydrogenase PdxA [Haloferax volcanii]|nr:4-hydroxythreonine-4-phosphate dehydrogenase PdxA [Haloferax volcanii]MBS8119267.1 4-hydroxythreonine-4-phosphate dehydrogenase PdxA [Haloferax volcanii]MBS8124280.1 4-hydroxythreonine-4-phosphate dehydrogenase PdxA [Haloferax volcanii]MBS8128149.1 4-hydroxythreonine-4-phosphate dehydrogenase PdxA [Haloferax volcanii]MBS8132014.1 4-hydroxythreonine-4-phosphate dehydrogenase PdxA [Haloferax volcanii]MDW7536336.1 4-hydroxythreonine-4-phosphate dehydrogenase PdxA [Haloferax volcanii]